MLLLPSLLKTKKALNVDDKLKVFNNLFMMLDMFKRLTASERSMVDSMINELETQLDILKQCCLSSGG